MGTHMHWDLFHSNNDFILIFDFSLVTRWWSITKVTRRGRVIRCVVRMMLLIFMMLVFLTIMLVLLSRVMGCVMRTLMVLTTRRILRRRIVRYIARLSLVGMSGITIRLDNPLLVFIVSVLTLVQNNLGTILAATTLIILVKGKSNRISVYLHLL